MRLDRLDDRYRLLSVRLSAHAEVLSKHELIPLEG